MLRRWCFFDSYLKLSWANVCYEKCGQISIANLITQELREDFYISGRYIGLCKVLSAEKITKSSN